MKIQEAIVLAGGKGTRLQTVVKDVPKPMANIRGRPFLEYILRYLEKQNIRHVVLSVGYLYETIQQYFGSHFGLIEITYCIENEPLGTGGGIQQALTMIREQATFVMNGDTAFCTDLTKFEDWHIEQGSETTLALKEMKNFDRYGIVTIDSNHNVLGFQEKQWRTIGLINAGLYIMPKDLFTRFRMPKKFSLEQDFFPKNLGQFSCKACVCEGYFIDIGIPEDYQRAQQEFSHFDTF